MNKAFAVALVLVFTSGCVRVMTPEEVDKAAKGCVERGGSPHFQTVSQYQNQVKWVDCYGADK